MSLGLHAAGFDCVGVVESDPSASTTYQANLSDPMSDASMVRLGPETGDMRRIGARQMADELARGGVEEGELDLLTAGPPCQGFSQVGRSKLDSIARQRGAFQHDERNELYLAVADLLPLVQPRAFVIENVPGILNHARVNVAERLTHTH
jgi:DNA (cytosine-5)-methyltransferase 1